MKELLIVEEDRVGLLAEISEILANREVNILSVSGRVAGNSAVIDLMTSDNNEAKSVLEDAGFKVGELEVLMLKLSDKPGELAKVCRKLADEKINIEGIHILGRKENEVVLLMRVSDVSRANKLLASYK